MLTVKWGALWANQSAIRSSFFPGSLTTGGPPRPEYGGSTWSLQTEIFLLWVSDRCCSRWLDIQEFFPVGRGRPSRPPARGGRRPRRRGGWPTWPGRRRRPCATRPTAGAAAAAAAGEATAAAAAAVAVAAHSPWAATGRRWSRPPPWRPAPCAGRAPPEAPADRRARRGRRRHHRRRHRAGGGPANAAARAVPMPQGGVCRHRRDAADAVPVVAPVGGAAARRAARRWPAAGALRRRRARGPRGGVPVAAAAAAVGSAARVLPPGAPRGGGHRRDGRGGRRGRGAGGAALWSTPSRVDGLQWVRFFFLSQAPWRGARELVLCWRDWREGLGARVGFVPLCRSSLAQSLSTRSPRTHGTKVRSESYTYSTGRLPTIWPFKNKQTQRNRAWRNHRARDIFLSNWWCSRICSVDENVAWPLCFFLLLRHCVSPIGPISGGSVPNTWSVSTRFWPRQGTFPCADHHLWVSCPTSSDWKPSSLQGCAHRSAWWPSCYKKKHHKVAGGSLRL